MTRNATRVKFSELCGFHPRQKEATEARRAHQYTLYGGSRGPGKSYWLRWDLLLQLIEMAQGGVRGATVGLFCEDYPVLRDRQISKIAVEFPSWLGELKESKEMGLGFHLRPEYGSGFLALRNLDDPRKYVSAEFAGIGVDELTRQLEDTFYVLQGSMRWPGVPAPRFTAATNPGNRGHAWVSGFWIDRQFPERMADVADQFHFVKALPDDNPHLTREYWEMLERLPEDLARAWRWGDWNVFAGLFFPTWRSVPIDGKQPHIVKSFDIPEYWSLYGSVDYGFHAGRLGEKPFCYELFAIGDDGMHEYLIDELAAAEWDIAKQCSEILKLEGRYKGKVRRRNGCKSMFTSREHMGPTIAEEYSKHGIQVSRSDNDKASGWAMCREWLADAPDEKPRLMVFDRCKQFVKIATSVIFDERHPEDIDPDCEDHAVETWRHHVMSRPRPGSAPKTKKREMSLAELKKSQKRKETSGRSW